MTLQAPQQASPDEAAPSVLRPRFSAIAALYYRDFRYLWIGTFFSSAGMWMQQVTLGWLVYAMTGSSVMLGLINGMRAIPFLLVGPVAGVVADRVDRRHLMFGTQILQVLTALVMGLLLTTGLIQIWHLFAFTLLTGVAWSVNQPVRQAVVANVVPRAALSNAVGLNSAAFNLTRIVGPGIGGLLILWVGAAGNFYIQAVAYLGVAAMVLVTRVPPTPLGARKSSMAANLKEGGVWVWRNPSMRIMMALALLPVLFCLPYMSLLPIFAEDVFDAGPSGLGILFSATGVGALAGALGVAARKDGRSQRLQLATLALLGLSLVVFSLTRTLPLAAICLVATGAFQQTYMATNQTIVQMLIPNELRGRVMAIYMLNQGLMPLGSLVAGFVTHLIGAPSTVAAMGGLCVILAGVASLYLPEIPDRELNPV